MYKLYHEVMMKNELAGGHGAYELSYAGGKSGFSFGRNQIDLSQNMDFSKKIVDILKNATDSKGVSFFTQDEVLYIAGKDNTNLTQSQKTLESAFSDNLPKIQAALSSEYGISKIDELYLHEIETDAKHIETATATAKMKNPAAKAFYETDVGKLLLFDYNNQFYIELDGAFLKKYIDGVLNDDVKVVFSTGEEIKAPIDTYTIEDHKHTFIAQNNMQKIQASA